MRRVSRPTTRRIWYVACLSRSSYAICYMISGRPSATIKHVRKRARRGYIRLCVNSVGEGRRWINGASFDRGPWYVELASLLSGRCVYRTAQCTFCRIAVRIRAIQQRAIVISICDLYDARYLLYFFLFFFRWCNGVVEANNHMRVWRV